jgi:hypothetical protein
MSRPDEGQSGVDAELPGAAQVSARVSALVERGLERYGKGDLPGALGEWEHALALDPSSAQAREYIDYVRENFATLDEQFRAASAMKDAVRASGMAVPEEPEEVSGAYDLVELEEGQTTPVGALSDVDGGWELDDLAAPLPPPPASAKPPSASSLDEDLAEVAAGLQFKDTGAPIPTMEEGEGDGAAGGGEGGAGGEDDDEGPGQVLELEIDEPDMPAVPVSQAGGDGDEEPITIPGGDEPPPLPERPALSAEAIAALGGRVPTVTIQPRTARGGTDAGTSAGTVPGFYPHDAVTPVPGELPAPPHVATPSELVLDMPPPEADVAAGEGGDGDADGMRIRIGLDSPAHRAPTAPEPGVEGSPDEPLPTGVGEPVGAQLLGLTGEDTGEATRPAGAKKALALLPEGEAEDLLTMERSSTSGVGELGADGAYESVESLELDTVGDFEDQPRTSERKALEQRSPFEGDETAGFTQGGQGEDGRAVSPADRSNPAVIVDEQLLRGLDDSGDEVTNARARLPSTIDQMGLAEPYTAMPRAGSEAPTNARGVLPPDIDAHDTDEDRIRRRVSELLALAREAAERGDHLSAVEAAEAASAEDPDGKVGPVILHRHRDLLYRVYEGHIGEMTQVPLLAVPLHQIAAEPLDHRTGFLLSRIDGLLSFEDILDVSGMPRLDAYRILSNLLRRGFIEVR